MPKTHYDQSTKVNYSLSGDNLINSYIGTMKTGLSKLVERKTVYYTAILQN